MICRYDFIRHRSGRDKVTNPWAMEAAAVMRPGVIVGGSTGTGRGVLGASWEVVVGQQRGSSAGRPRPLLLLPPRPPRNRRSAAGWLDELLVKVAPSLFLASVAVAGQSLDISLEPTSLDLDFSALQPYLSNPSITSICYCSSTTQPLLYRFSAIDLRGFSDCTATARKSIIQASADAPSFGLARSPNTPCPRTSTIPKTIRSDCSLTSHRRPSKRSPK